MRKLSKLLIFQLLLSFCFTSATYSINELRGQIIPTVNYYQASKGYFPNNHKIACSIRSLYESSPIPFLEMVNSFNDIAANELIFWCLDIKYSSDHFTFDLEKDDLFWFFLVHVNHQIWKLFKRPFSNSTKLQESIAVTLLLIRIAEKNIAKARKQWEISPALEKKLATFGKTLICWKYAIRHFSFDFDNGTVEFAAFSLLLDRIMEFSLLPDYNVDNEKHYFLFEVYLTQLWNSHLAGLYEAHVKNILPITCYLYDYWELRCYKCESTFRYFKDYQNDGKRGAILALERMKRDILSLLDIYRDYWHLDIPFYPNNLVIKAVNSSDEVTTNFTSAFRTKLKAAAFLETQIVDHSLEKTFSE
jgi:hypothetical protein